MFQSDSHNGRGIDCADVRLLTLQESAIVLGVSRWTVRRLIDSGELAVVRLPGWKTESLRRVLIDRADLEALISRSKEKENP